MYEVWFILLDGFDLFEAIAATHAFDLANLIPCSARQCGLYTVRLLTNGAAPVRSNGEVALNAQALPDELGHRVDRMILVGDNNAAQALRQPTAAQRHLVGWLASQRPHIGHLVAIGETAFVLTQSALVRAGAPATCGSLDVTASSSGLELALRIIAADVGHRIAMQVAQRLQPLPERFGAPFRLRSSLCGDACADERVLVLNRWIASHLRLRLTNELLARRLAMTERTFARWYLRATGFTPARAVEQIRLEHACQLAETTLMTFKEIAQRSGFSSQEVMRRTFIRVLHMSPSRYRQQFCGRV